MVIPLAATGRQIIPNLRQFIEGTISSFQCQLKALSPLGIWRKDKLHRWCAKQRLAICVTRQLPAMVV